MRTGSGWSTLIAVVVLIVALLGWRADTRPVVGAASNETARVRIGSGETPSYAVPPGGERTITVEVVGAANLGAAIVLLAYDPALVQVVGCTAQPPANADLALCNPSYSPGVVRFSLLAAEGVHGSFPLFSLTLRALAASGATAQLAVTVPQFADTRGLEMPVEVSGGALMISGPDQPAEAVLRLDPAVSQIAPGQLATVGVQIAVTSERPLVAATLLLQYDPHIVRPVQCTTSAGSSLQGACNVNFNRTQGLVKFNLLAAQGASGLLDLYDIVFEVVGTALPNAVSPLTLSVETITDAASSPLRWRAEGGSLTVSASAANAAQLQVGDVQSSGQFTLEHGAAITVPVWVVDVTNLGALTVDLGFDPALLEPLRCIPTVAVSVNAAALGMDGGQCVIEEKRVLANFVAGQGFSGSALLFEVVFTPRTGAPSGENAALLLDAVNFADVNAAPLPWRARNGAIRLLPGAPSAVPLVGLDASVGAPPSLPQDGELTVTLSLSGAVNVGVAAVEVHFDPAVVRVVSCTPNPGFDGTVCAMGEGKSQITVLDGDGFTGSAPMATLVFRAAAKAEVGAQTNLTVSMLNFTDVDGDPLRYQVSTGAIQITEATSLAADVLLRLTPDLIDVIPGRQFQVRLEALLDGGALSHGLDVVTLRLLYDPAVLQPLACTHNPNAFLGGACNLAFAPGQIRLSLVGRGDVWGQTRLAQIQFQTLGQIDDSTPLRLEVDALLTPTETVPSYRTQTAQVTVTLDGDGVPNEVENGAPNNGDGNHDGIPDAEQLHVTSLLSPISGNYVTLVAGVTSPPSAQVTGRSEAQVGCLINLRFLSNPSPEDTPSGWSADLGFLGFTLGCLPLQSSATVTVSLHSVSGLGLTQFFTYAPPPAETGWQSFLREDNLGASFTSTGFVLQLADGQKGDGDDAVNGEIEFLGAPGTPGVAIGVAPRSLIIAPSRAGTVGVVLLARPLAPVLVNLSTAGRAVVSPAQLSFTLDNWSVVQRVTVRTASGLSVPNADLIQPSASSADAAYSGLVIQAVAVVIQEDTEPMPATATPTVTPTATAGGGPQTPTATPTATSTATTGGPQTATPTATSTATTGSGPRTATPTATSTATTGSGPQTPTATSTATTGSGPRTPTATPTATTGSGPQTATTTATSTATAGGGPRTPTATPTATSTATTGSGPRTATPTATLTATTGGGPQTSTATPTVTPTPTANGGPQTPTATPTATTGGGPRTPTATPTATTGGGPRTPTATSTATAGGGPQTPTATSTATTGSGPQTATTTATSTATAGGGPRTPTATPTATSTATTGSGPRTATPTATSTATPTNMPVPHTATFTPTVTRTNTPTPTATLTPVSVPSTATPTVTLTATVAPPSATPTSTATPTSVPPTATVTATVTATPTNTTMPPTATPTHTPQVALQISRIEPNQGLGTVPNEVAIYGAGLRADTLITIGGVALSNYTQTDAQGKLALAVVPRGLLPGVHDVSAVNPDSASFTLPGGYTVIDESLPDLSVANRDIWFSPVTVRTGAEAALGVNVHRSGGSEMLPGVDVAFYLNEISNSALLGRRTTGTFMPGNDVVASVAISWTPPAVGLYTVVAVIDPDGAVAEGAETNNIAQWTVEVLPPPDVVDTTPPSMTAVTANGGAQSTTQQEVSLEIGATDQGSGLHSMYIVERVYNNSARAWVMIQESRWITYSTPHVLALNPAAGLHYLQVWVADAAGNIANSSARVAINYLPAQSTVSAGQVRIYRLVLAAGDPLRAAVTPLSGDPDLYVWDEESNLVAYSNFYDETPELVAYTATRTGVYQIEVHGYGNSNYAMTLEPTLAQLAQAASTPADKVLPLRPSVAPAIAPPAQQALPVAPVAPPPSAIGLVSFDATYGDGVVLVNWVTGWEQNTFGFHIYRGETNEFANAVRLTQELIPAKGSGGGGYAGYVYADPSALLNQPYWYWLVEQEFSGATNLFGPVPMRTTLSPMPNWNGSLFLPLVTR